MRKYIYRVLVCMFALTMMISGAICLASENAPAELTSALILKLAQFEKNLSGAESKVSVHVIGSPDIAADLQKAKGAKIGKATLETITESNELPTTKPSMICLASSGKLAEVVKYAKENKVLTFTNLPDLVEKGIMLGIGIGADGKPEVLLNQTASAEAGMDWSPAILKIAKTIK